MNRGKFATSVNECIELLKLFDMLKDDRSGNISNFSKDYMQASRSGDYFKIYDSVIKNLDYTFLLKDESYLQFHINGESIGYIFMQNPRRHPDIDTFKKDFYGDNEIPEDELVQFHESYEQYLDEQSLNNDAVYMRLDNDKKNYTEFLHSLAHLHININSNIRIPLDKILTPLAFCCFVIKHVYYDNWKNITSKKSFSIYTSKLKESLFDHPKEFWKENDQLNLHLT